MQSQGREPSMEDILASIKKVIAEEKELRTTVHPPGADEEEPLPTLARDLIVDQRRSEVHRSFDRLV